MKFCNPPSYPTVKRSWLWFHWHQILPKKADCDSIDILQNIKTTFLKWQSSSAKNEWNFATPLHIPRFPLFRSKQRNYIFTVSLFHSDWWMRLRFPSRSHRYQRTLLQQQGTGNLPGSEGRLEKWRGSFFTHGCKEIQNQILMIMYVYIYIRTIWYLDSCCIFDISMTSVYISLYDISMPLYIYIYTV